MFQEHAQGAKGLQAEVAAVRLPLTDLRVELGLAAPALVHRCSCKLVYGRLYNSILSLCTNAREISKCNERKYLSYRLADLASAISLVNQRPFMNAKHSHLHIALATNLGQPNIIHGIG